MTQYLLFAGDVDFIHEHGWLNWLVTIIVVRVAYFILDYAFTSKRKVSSTNEQGETILITNAYLSTFYQEHKIRKYALWISIKWALIASVLFDILFFIQGCSQKKSPDNLLLITFIVGILFFLLFWFLSLIIVFWSYALSGGFVKKQIVKLAKRIDNVEAAGVQSPDTEMVSYAKNYIVYTSGCTFFLWPFIILIINKSLKKTPFTLSNFNEWVDSSVGFSGAGSIIILITVFLFSW